MQSDSSTTKDPPSSSKSEEAAGSDKTVVIEEESSDLQETTPTDTDIETEIDEATTPCPIQSEDRGLEVKESDNTQDEPPIMSATDASSNNTEKATTNHNEHVCWICYEPFAPDDETKVMPCKCSGSVSAVHQECLIEWMNQTNATACPHCHYNYEIKDEYPSVVHKMVDHEWIPACTTITIILTMFIIFRYMYNTAKRMLFARHPSNPPPSVPTQPSLASVLANHSTHLLPSIMHGGALPAQLLFPGGDLGTSLASSSKWSFMSLVTEIEIFTFGVMILYSITKFVHQRYAQPTTSDTQPAQTSWPATLWGIVDDEWRLREASSRGASHEEFVYMLPIQVLLTLYNVTQLYVKYHLQRWAQKKRLVKPYAHNKTPSASERA